MDLSIDPTQLNDDYHDIAPLQARNEVPNLLGYLPTVEPFLDIAGTSEIRSVIVDYIRDNGIERPERNRERNNQIING